MYFSGSKRRFPVKEKQIGQTLKLIERSCGTDGLIKKKKFKHLFLKLIIKHNILENVMLNFHNMH